MISDRPRLSGLVTTPSERRALGVFALLAVLALIWLSLPVSSGLFLGTLLAFSLLGAYDRLAEHLGRPGPAALSIAVGSGLMIIGGVAVLLWFVIARGIAAAVNLAHGFDPGGPLRNIISRLEDASQSTPFGRIDLVGHVREAAANAASRLTGWAAAAAGAGFGAVLMLFFTIMTTFFVLRHWPEIVERAERMLPLNPMHTRVVLAEFQIVGKEVFVGTILTGIAQGFLAGVGYALGNVPEPALLAALTAIASLIPAVGTLLIWVPLGLILIFSGRVGAGIFELVWGALVVGVLSDYVIRPKLVGGSGHVPTLFTFISLFGGVELFGLLGLIIGPVIAAVALALLRTYDREVCNRGFPEPGPPPSSRVLPDAEPSTDTP